jgi:hypothetical protein
MKRNHKSYYPVMLPYPSQGKQAYLTVVNFTANDLENKTHTFFPLKEYKHNIPPKRLTKEYKILMNDAMFLRKS